MIISFHEFFIRLGCVIFLAMFPIGNFRNVNKKKVFGGKTPKYIQKHEVGRLGQPLEDREPLPRASHQCSTVNW